jgi:hypothetical protein
MNPAIPAKTLLAVVDEVSIQMILQHYFQENFQVITKGNGGEALNWIHAGVEKRLRKIGPCDL